MDNKVLPTLLAGIGIGYLAFSAEGQKLLKGVGQSILPALAQGQMGGGAKNDSESTKEDEEKSKSQKEEEE